VARDIDLSKTMRAKNPTFTFMYSTSTPIYQRFAKCLSTPMLHVNDGNLMCAAAFYANPELASQGVALPVNELDRRDLPVPAIIEHGTGKEYRYRDAQRWLLRQLQNQGTA
jgi:hypothetical protein